jgi:hypothetical protein
MDTPARVICVLDSSAALSKLVHLQELMVGSMIGGLSADTLPSMEHLVSLSVHSLSIENLLQLGALTCLQELTMCVDPDTTVVGPSSVPGLVFPTSLTSLKFMLSPVEASILSLVPARLQELRLECDVKGPAEGPGSFLSCVGDLQHLTRLEFFPCPAFAMPPPCPAYSYLTASSSLARFELHAYAYDFPAGLWPHIFPAGRKLTGLHTLVWGPEDRDAFVVDLPSAWSASDLSFLVSCCLRQALGIYPQHGLHVCELQKLIALSQLDLQFLAGGQDNCMESMKGIAALTQVKWLHVTLTSHVDQPLPVTSLLPLTSLTALTKLDCALHTYPVPPRGNYQLPGWISHR